MSYTTLILVLILIESNGDDSAVGDNGKAYGCLQLHAEYVADAAEYAGIGWSHEDAFDPDTAIEIFTAYMSRYATPKRLGRIATAEDIARIHNGGPNGYKKKSTKAYWNKISPILN
jgi:hypothetical protein|tara:strand:- start:11595 stop:11942 length:348 start_codon:yes stop_codon:yes gene_type:complete